MTEKKNNIVATVSFCLYVADPAAFLAPNDVLRPCFPLRTTCLFSYGKKISISVFVSLTY